MRSSDITIRTVPNITNPMPRPSTPGRPGTSSGLINQSGFSLGTTGTSFNVFDSDEPVKSVFDDMITAEYLQGVAGTEDLSSVTSLTLRVDTSYQSLLDIGDLLRRLDHLVLDGSKISSVRDLGVGLMYLSSLSLNDCGLTELDGIGMLTSLKQLSARDNNIEDVTALALHETIESIDLHRNKITDVSVADTLSSCPSLRHLVLSANAIERAPKYSLVVAAMIPQLETLDGLAVDRNAKNKVSNGMILEAASAMQLEQEELDDERRMEMELMGDDLGFCSSYTPSGSLQQQKDASAGRRAGEATCTLPDHGSDLTHGSDVVLAGSMASAIRRRRNASPRASQDQNQDQDQDGGTGSRGSSAGRGHAERDEQYFGEGDITKAMQQSDRSLKSIMSSSPKSSQYRQKSKKPPPISMSLDVNISSEHLSSHTPRNLNNPIAAAIISAAHSQNAMSFDYDSGEDGAATGVSGVTPAGWASRPLSRHNSRRGSATSSRSPSPSTRNNSSAEGRKPPKSPPTWQRNASRPQSTASSARGSTAHGIAGGMAPSAPFKVTHSSSSSDMNLKSGRSSPSSSPPCSRGNKASLPPSKGVLPDLGRSRGPREGVRGGARGSLWDDSSGPGDSDSNSDTSKDERGGGVGQRCSRGVGPLVARPGVGSGAVVVKKDNVLRGLLFDDDEPVGRGGGGIPAGGLPAAKREAGFSFEHQDQEDEDEDEDFSSDRKSRHEFMRTEQKERESNKHKHRQMMTFSQQAGGGGGHSPQSAAARGALRSSHSEKSADDLQESSINLSECIQPAEHEKDTSVSGKQLSEVATRSLGFDLKGSLAAINQWVDDQDSEEEEDEDEEEGGAVSKYSEVWSMRSEMKRASTAQQKILSRDKILGMCTGAGAGAGGQRGGDCGPRLTATNLALNTDSGFSYDQDDEDESDCEENEVVFYDNSVDKTANSLNKSCSLLTIGGFGEVGAKDSKLKEREERQLMSKSVQLERQQPRPKQQAPPRNSSVAATSSTDPSVSASASSRSRSTSTSTKRAQAAAVVTVTAASEEEPGVVSRGCTPSSSSTPASSSSSSAPPPAKSTLETDVRSSPSSDARALETAAKQASSHAAKKTRPKVALTAAAPVAGPGPALSLSDEQLVTMLRQPPKAVAAIKTRSGFQDFFRGVSGGRMRDLLGAAYQDLAAEERSSKVQKRMELLGDVLAAD